MLVGFTSLFISVVFFFKQKTAYEMRISDWSSDVCSSDLLRQPPRDPAADAADALDRDAHALGAVGAQPFADRRLDAQIDAERGQRAGVAQIGRASCRERVCQYG